MARGFTILEILIVVVLLGAIVAVSLPFLDSRAEARAFEAAGDQIRDTLIRLRAESQRSGRAIRLTVERRGSVAHLCREDLELQVDLELGADDPGGSDEADAMMDMMNAFENKAASVLALPMGVDLREHDPREDVDFVVDQSIEGVVDAGLDAFGVEFEEDPATLCVLLPDGSVMPGETMFLFDTERLARLRVSAWTGEATFESLDLDSTGDDLEESFGTPPMEGATGSGSQSGGSPESRPSGAAPRIREGTGP